MLTIFIRFYVYFLKFELSITVLIVIFYRQKEINMSQKICIKIGSNVLTEQEGFLDISRIAHLVRQLKELTDQGHELFLISSGAVAAGRRFVNLEDKNNVVAERQVCSAIGQVHLINLYQRLLTEYNMTCAQVLVTRHDFEDRNHYLNMKNALDTMSNHKIIPIINENDTVAVTELMFTDNDELAGLIATMLGADKLIILSNIDGLYNGHPDDPESSVIAEIDAAKDDFSHVVGAAKSTFGRGGMHSKYRISCSTAKAGTDVFITNGTRDNILVDIVTEKPVPRTRFTVTGAPKSQLKTWISSSANYAKATIVVDEGATNALLSESASSLLLVGVSKINGHFERGEIINIVDVNDKLIAVGRAGMSAKTANENIGKRYSKALVHYDYLCLV